MPISAGSSPQVIARNISEFHGGKTFEHTAKKFGKETARKQAIAVALKKAGKSYVNARG